MNNKIDLSKILNKKTLIIGEVGTGKTRLLIHLVRQLISNELSTKVTVIDMAPPKIFNIGGRVLDYDASLCTKIRYLYSDDIRPPRLTGKTPDEVLKIAAKNYEITDKLIDRYILNPTDILLINDLTIYAHAGDASKLNIVIKNAATFVGTAYYGRKLSDDKGSGITIREKQYIEDLSNIVDCIVKL
ncbi:MAG: hypothetical protein QXQ02_03950 [Halobacteria archaeon]